ncbi:hypothetical protein KP509_02G065200 [Ceratopteris richardii]|uniref:Uncharacterized protein n=1 Tax=Ceratopteris richardii TaxID=49495 RepID=A0A8T2VAL3_CERRI|nr:hypothetical protein KP509_02G065200 [Ceratopteris richardii]
MKGLSMRVIRVRWGLVQRLAISLSATRRTTIAICYLIDVGSIDIRVLARLSVRSHLHSFSIRLMRDCSVSLFLIWVCFLFLLSCFSCAIPRGSVLSPLLSNLRLGTL